MREQYGAMFDGAPDLRAEILGRVSAGDWTVDHERVSHGDETRELLVAYLVEDDSIRRVLMLRLRRRAMGWWKDQVVPHLVEVTLRGREIDELRSLACEGLHGRVLETRLRQRAQRPLVSQGGHPGGRRRSVRRGVGAVR